MPEHVLYEVLHGQVARLWLNRPEVRNAQDLHLLRQLDAAFARAVADPDVRAIVLAAKGPHFSAGHDLKEFDLSSGASIFEQPRIGVAETENGVDAYYVREEAIYLEFCLRWRDLPKPTVAAVQGKCMAGGLMLVWPCDFIVASEDASFQDNTLLMGIPGAEYFAHPWELGVRRAKEFLLLGEPMNAREALNCGMVSKVVATEGLHEAALELARALAQRPPFALKLAKDSINQVYVAQGFALAQRSAFNAHHLAHAHHRLERGSYLDTSAVAQHAARPVSGPDVRIKK